MKKTQRVRYEMFVRVRDFGAANGALFPESSAGGQSFVRVAAVVAAVDGHVASRVVARAEARKVKATARAAVLEKMRIMAATGRRASRQEAFAHAFRMPRRGADKVLVGTARAFAAEARKREAEFVRLGLPSTFISEFESLVDSIDQAVNVRNSSSHLRRKHQAGIEAALKEGAAELAELDVVVPNVLRENPVLLAQWRRARHIAGMGAPAPVKVPAPVIAPVTVERPPVDLTDVTDVAPATEETTMAPAHLLEEEVLDKAS